MVKVPVELLAQVGLEPLRPGLEPLVNVAVGTDGGEELGEERDEEVVVGHDVDEEVVGDLANLKQRKM